MKIIPLVTLVVAGQSRAPGSDAVEIQDGEARNLIARGFAREADPEPAVTGDGDGAALQPVAPDPEPTPEPEKPKGRRK